MRIDYKGICRGDGVSYTVFDIDEHDGISFDVTQKHGEALIPSEAVVVPCDNSRDAYLIVVAPLHGLRDWVTTVVGKSDCGETCCVFKRGFINALLPWQSRLNYQFNPELGELVQSIFKIKVPCLSFALRCLIPSGNEYVLKGFINAASSDSFVNITLYDPQCEPMDTKPVVLSDRVTGPKGREEREVTFSVRVPMDKSGYFVLFEDAKGNNVLGAVALAKGQIDRFLFDCRFNWKTASNYSAAEYMAFSSSFKATDRELQEQREAAWENPTFFSVLVPLYKTPVGYLNEMIESLVSQSYRNWELILGNASPEDEELQQSLDAWASKEDRIVVVPLGSNRGISENTRLCSERASGDFVAFLDHDDKLEPDCLYEYAKAICDNREIDVLYCDEDFFNDEGMFYDPHLKSDFNIDLLRCHNYITHLLAIRKTLLDEVGGISSSDFDGAQDYDLTLRAVEKARIVQHVPRILYHWRMHEGSTNANADSKPLAHDAGKLALLSHFERCGIVADAEDTGIPFVYRPHYQCIGRPLVSIVIPNKDCADMLQKCVNSILEVSTYGNIEIIIVENNSSESETFECYERLRAEDKRIRVVTWDKPFNFSSVVNYGESFAQGEYVLLLNNDTEVITPDFLEEMVSFCQRPDVGIVGAKLLYPDDTIQHAGVGIGLCDGAAHLYIHHDRDAYGYKARLRCVQDLSCVTGACLMVKKGVYDEIGGFDSEFVVAFNDVDFCLRVRKLGYKVVFTPYAELHHHESFSRGSDDAKESLKKRARFFKETSLLQYRWSEEIVGRDPYLNAHVDIASMCMGLDEARIVDVSRRSIRELAAAFMRRL